MSLATQLTERLEQKVLDDAGREVAESVRQETISNLEDAEQGADGLVEHVGEVEEVSGSYEFEIDHPTAKLHENGGHIEPTYAQAMIEGYTRDEFYAALKDCNEWVTRKRYIENAVFEVRRRQE